MKMLPLPRIRHVVQKSIRALNVTVRFPVALVIRPNVARGAFVTERPLKYWTNPFPFTTFPLPFGRLPTRSAVLAVRKPIVPSTNGIAVVPGVNESGAPLIQENADVSCQPSTTRWTTGGAPARNGRLGPNGRSHTPFALRTWVRSIVSSPLSSRRFRGSRRVPPLNVAPFTTPAF